MASLSHTMQRKAFSAAIDVALKRLNKDREKGLLQIIDLAQRFMGDNFKPEVYEGAKNRSESGSQMDEIRKHNA